MSRSLLALLTVILIIVGVFAGCSQTQLPKNDELEDPKIEEETKEDKEPEQLQITPDNPLPTADAIPEDYVGVWLRQATYVNGVLEGQTPATWTLNKDSYTSTGTCTNTGRIISNKDGSFNITMDSSSCPGAQIGASYTYTYSIVFDKEQDIEVMTVKTGPITEIYNRIE